MKKKWAIAALAVFCLLLLVFSIQCSIYRVKPDNSNLAQQVNLWLNRTQSGTIPYPQNDITIYDYIDLGPERYVQMEVNGQLGLIQLLRGLTKNYKIEVTSRGGGNFKDWIVEQDGSRYLLLMGRNAVFGIERMTFTVDGREYGLTIPHTSPFFLYTELVSSQSNAWLDWDTVRFYDADGEDITQQVPWVI